MNFPNFPLNSHWIAWASFLTQQTALAVWPHVGRGDPTACDAAAVATMRSLLNHMPLSACVVAGEGERDQAPLLASGETFGKSVHTAPILHLAVDPLECTSAAALGLPGACSLLAIAPEGHLLKTPDVYMHKLAISPGKMPKGLDLDLPLPELCTRLAQARDLPVSDLHIGVLDRPRHKDIIKQLRTLGCHLHLIPDGDVFGVLKTVRGEWHLYVGIGGAPEGILAAAALGNTGGWMQGRLLFPTPSLQDRAAACGLTDLSKIYNLRDMASQETLFSATAITRCDFLAGLKPKPGENSRVTGFLSHTLILFKGHHHRLQTYHPPTASSHLYQGVGASVGLQLPDA